MVSYEKLLEKVLRAAEMLPDEERRAFHYFSNTNEIHGNAVMTSQALAEIANDLRAAIAEQTEKAAGRGSAQKAMMRIVKRAPRDNVKCAWMQGEKQYVCDGAVAIELNVPISGLPAPASGVAPFDAFRVIDPAQENSGDVLPVPSLAKIKAHIKNYRAELKAAGKKSNFVPLDLGAELPLMNAEILADILEIVPDATFTASRRNPQRAAVYFEGASGRGCVLPVRRKPSSVA